MRKYLQLLVTRLDVLSVRERIFFFVSAVLCSAALFDAVWLSPAQTVHKQLTVRLDKQGAELQRMRELVKTTVKTNEVPAPIDEELQRLALQTDQINALIRDLLPRSQGTPLVQALTHLLRRHPGLTLVQTSVLAPEVAGPGNTKSTGLPQGLNRQGVAITVAGAYPDLNRFVSTLEAQLPHVRWGAMNLKSEKGQPELTLQLFVLTEVAK
jgi:MSHA biogenesis protein MshJ